MELEKDEVTLSMDETDKPDLVDAPSMVHEVKDEPTPEAAEAKPEQPRGPDGKFASKEKGETEAQPQVEAPPASEPESPTVPRRALEDERRKRQELEQQIAAMQQQFAQPKPQEAPPQFWDDPDRALEARMEQFGSQLIQRFQQQQTMERINASETAARAKYADYGDAFSAFQQAAQANPSLIQQMTGASDPAEFAYKTGKTALELAKVGSIDELLAQKRAEWEAELKASVPQAKPSFPTSTVADGSVASRGGPVWAGPVSDRDILPMG